jgi:hypothetical protein
MGLIFIHSDFKFIRSAQVSTHHKLDQNGNTIAMILKFSLG